jgi:hypothetical protein
VVRLRGAGRDGGDADVGTGAGVENRGRVIVYAVSAPGMLQDWLAYVCLEWGLPFLLLLISFVLLYNFVDTGYWKAGDSVHDRMID